MLDEPTAAETQDAASATVSTIDTVIVVPNAEEHAVEPAAQVDYGSALVSLELRVAALEAARVEELNDDDGSNDTGSDDAGTGSGEAEAEETEEREQQRPISRHWLFGRIW